MSYRHFGRIGDIWKHIPLCEFLAIEQPTSYIETNSAFPEYQLTGTFEQQYGVLDVEKNIKKSQIIQQSVYWKSLITMLPDVSPHDLRHRFGYRMAEVVPLHRLAQIMGHDSLDTTMIYIRGTQRNLQKEVEKIAWE
jgi:integrase